MHIYVVGVGKYALNKIGSLRIYDEKPYLHLNKVVEHVMLSSVTFQNVTL